MKKLIAMGLTVIMTAVAVCGCGSSDSGNDAKKSDNQTKQQAVKVIDVDLTSEEYAFGVDKNKPELLTQVNDFIKEIKDNGTFDEICNKYFGGGNPTPVKSEKLDTSKDQLLVATNASFEPFEYMKGDSYYGIDMEIAAALAKKLNKELVIQNMEFDSVCLSVGQHAVWAPKIPVPHTDVLKTHESQSFSTELLESKTLLLHSQGMPNHLP